MTSWNFLGHMFWFTTNPLKHAHCTEFLFPRQLQRMKENIIAVWCLSQGTYSWVHRKPKEQRRPNWFLSSTWMNIRPAKPMLLQVPKWNAVFTEDTPGRELYCAFTKGILLNCNVLESVQVFSWVYQSSLTRIQYYDYCSCSIPGTS